MLTFLERTIMDKSTADREYRPGDVVQLRATDDQVYTGTFIRYAQRRRMGIVRLDDVGTGVYRGSTHPWLLERFIR